MNYSAPLHVFVVHHPDFPAGSNTGEILVRWLSGDPDAHAVPPADVPTFVWTAAPSALPAAIPFGAAERTVVVLLVDDAWMASREWRDWATATAGSKGGRDAVVVAAMSASALGLGAPLDRRNAMRIYDAPPDRQDVELRLRVTHLLARALLGARTASIFLSHAKNGGRGYAEALRAFLNGRPLGTHFFDEVSIEAGEDFEEALKDGLRASVVVVLLTDRFASRYWCAWEVITAKAHQRPILLVDALEEGEPASLAYAGNTRTIRWEPERADDIKMHESVVAGALLELLRHQHNSARVGRVLDGHPHGGHAVVVWTAPELAMLPAPAAGSNTLVLHPDPPLAAFEVALIQRHRPDISIVSITQALAGSDGSGGPLGGKRIAISISDAPDRAARGLSKIHQEQLWARLASILLAASAELAYGGDLRTGGYTERLWDLVRSAVKAGGRLPRDVVHSYLGWPIPLLLTTADRANVPDVIRLHEFSVPSGLLVDPDVFIPSNDLVPEHHFAWTASMASMRSMMAAECHARVMVGGQFRSVSPIPGLIDEFLSFAGDKPVYLAGAYGGMTRVIIRALLGERPVELTRAFQEDAGSRAALMAYYDSQLASGAWPQLLELDYDAIVDRLRAIGPDGLGNGLTSDENLRLFWSRDLLEISALVLTGLRRVFGS